MNVGRGGLLNLGEDWNVRDGVSQRHKTPKRKYPESNAMNCKESEGSVGYVNSGKVPFEEKLLQEARNEDHQVHPALVFVV